MTRTLRAGLMAGLLVFASCGHGQPDIATLTSNSDQVIWEAGQKALQKHDWESARQHFKRIIDAFPQSQYAPSARLALGDTYIEEGGTSNDILAIGAYREFLTLYPSHPKSDYAQFQVAESYFRQKSGPDRDQTQTLHALEEYERLLDLYPSSPYIEQARGRIKESRQNLARAEYMAGYFYQKTRQYCRAAVARYEGILKDYPDFDDLDLVLLHMAECLHAQGRTAEALPHLGRLLEDFPESAQADTARSLMEEWSHEPVTPAPPSPTPPPPPATAPPTAPPAAPVTAPSPLPSPPG
ncbi:MAG TPA: outer membrane protein assembly factor BamD [Vicinamibacteria bacterium]|jgi:outer membrane protein assembly factor BamD